MAVLILPQASAIRESIDRVIASEDRSFNMMRHLLKGAGHRQLPVTRSGVSTVSIDVNGNASHSVK